MSAQQLRAGPCAESNDRITDLNHLSGELAEW